ncbi:MAG: PilZ domain-containing protein [bacterium]|nr:PilZ domain-containing protein [bacterium]
MGIFQTDLPLSLCPIADNAEGQKHQGLLKKVDGEHILVETGDSLKLAVNEHLAVEFRLQDSNFRFETSVANLAGPRGLLLLKPKIIHRSKVREGPRVALPLEVQYTLWTESGRFSGGVLDISESGLRMHTPHRLSKGQLLSLDFYIKAAQCRVITQALVVWVRDDEERTGEIQAAVHFTTIANDARKKLARHLLSVAQTQAD